MTELVERDRADRREGDANGRRPERPLRAVAAILGALVLTPVAIGIAANGAVLTGRWWDATDRWLAPIQSVLGAVLLLAVAALAAAVPVAAMAAGLVWGILPAAVQIVIPERTYRLVSAVPGLPTDLDHALYSWLSGGVMLMVGVLLFGTGLTAGLLRRRLAG
ncbi:hypothetical protein HGA13_16660 [Nocardia speluncae]|uniref:Uncharacterized protein n=1 Tax=Nocardia speluncae TaxID=419477 RepID=A0A846XLT9_9NOCA|nr:hypothetical protein [Nocardia speluncae]NKY34694.1 hypothetical protein [Nocardia speluncae]